MDQKRIGAFIAQCRREKNLTQMQLAGLLGITSQAVSKWENGLSVPDSSMLVSLAEELDISVSTLLGEVVQEESLNEGNLKSISEKLEIINLQLIKRSEMRMRTIRYFFISVCTIIVTVFIAFAAINSEYLTWNFNNPELAVAGTFLHGFEFLFVRLAPFVFIGSVIGIIVTYKKR
ncbi:MAG: helix-turn-helix domain-containing protein [Christensenellales bacterium]